MGQQPVELEITSMPRETLVWAHSAELLLVRSHVL